MRESIWDEHLKSHSTSTAFIQLYGVKSQVEDLDLTACFLQTAGVYHCGLGVDHCKKGTLDAGNSVPLVGSF